MALTPTTAPGFTPPAGEGTAPAATYGANIPQNNMYGAYQSYASANQRTYATTAQDPASFTPSLNLNVYDPHGAGVRPREYYGPWVNPADPRYQGKSEYTLNDGKGTGVGGYVDANGQYVQNDAFKINHMLMTTAQSFDPFMQRKLMERPHWWVTRVPRGAFPLFSGSVHETRIFRGGLGHYAGLYDWEDLTIDPTKGDACAPMSFRTYQYAWEALAWSGKKTAWGSDPICIDQFKFTPNAAEQLGWILEVGVKFGIDIQNVWNRDMFIYYSVMAGRSFVMTSQYRGDKSPRYFYNPFVKFSKAGDTPGAGIADSAYVTKPFIVFDASADIQPLNFDVLDLVRTQLKRRCPDSAVGRIGNEPMFAIAVSVEDVDNYIRGNENERRNFLEADPRALIRGYDFTSTTFRRWTITDDENQLRFKLKAYYAAGDWTSEFATLHYGGVGKELAGKPVYVAEFVPPEIGGRPGINGAPVPEPNDEYDLAELAIAPIFMNKVFTNLFVPDVNGGVIGHGTWFGAKKGLNGQWGWYNIQTPENPDNKYGNFKGEFHIVPKPETCVYDTISFLYRRCAQPLPSFCPAENIKVNPTLAKVTGVTDATLDSITRGTTSDTVVVAFMPAERGFTAGPGDEIAFVTADSADAAMAAASGSGARKGFVFGTDDSGRIRVQLTITPSEDSVTDGSDSDSLPDYSDAQLTALLGSKYAVLVG